MLNFSPKNNRFYCENYLFYKSSTEWFFEGLFGIFFDTKYVAFL